MLRIKIKGIDDRTTAENLVGTEFYAPRGVLPELKTEEVYYEADLVGMKVLGAKLSDKEKEEIDEAVEIAKKAEVAEVGGFYNFGAGDILEIRLKSGRSEMLPFNKGYVPEINLDEGYIIVASTGMVFLEDGEDSEEC